MSRVTVGHNEYYLAGCFTVFVHPVEIDRQAIGSWGRDDLWVFKGMQFKNRLLNAGYVPVCDLVINKYIIST